MEKLSNELKILRLKQIKEELYTYVNADEVDKYYKSVLDYCIRKLLILDDFEKEKEA